MMDDGTMNIDDELKIMKRFQSDWNGQADSTIGTRFSMSSSADEDEDDDVLQNSIIVPPSQRRQVHPPGFNVPLYTKSNMRSAQSSQHQHGDSNSDDNCHACPLCARNPKPYESNSNRASKSSMNDPFGILAALFSPRKLTGAGSRKATGLAIHKQTLRRPFVPRLKEAESTSKSDKAHAFDKPTPMVNEQTSKPNIVANEQPRQNEVVEDVRVQLLREELRKIMPIAESSQPNNSAKFSHEKDKRQSRKVLRKPVTKRKSQTNQQTNHVSRRNCQTSPESIPLQDSSFRALKEALAGKMIKEKSQNSNDLVAHQKSMVAHQKSNSTSILATNARQAGANNDESVAMNDDELAVEIKQLPPALIQMLIKYISNPESDSDKAEFLSQDQNMAKINVNSRKGDQPKFGISGGDHTENLPVGSDMRKHDMDLPQRLLLDETQSIEDTMSFVPDPAEALFDDINSYCCCGLMERRTRPLGLDQSKI